MATYIIMSELRPEALSDPKDFKRLAANVSDKIKAECPGVKWKDSYTLLGEYDVLDIVESEDPKQVEKAAMIIRAYGYEKTKTFAATQWKEFLDTL